VEIFGWNFSAKNYSSLEFISLSSAAMVNAACVVHKADSAENSCGPLHSSPLVFIRSGAIFQAGKEFLTN
jgi:hypothetical protein